MQHPSDALAPEVLAAKLLARALHDVVGPTSGLTSALDLLGDGDNRDLHAEALSLARDSLSEMGARIAFCRAAFGIGGGLDVEGFVKLIATPFAGSRARLELGQMTPGAPPVLYQGALILLQITAEALASGGAARLTIERLAGQWRARVDGAGVRAQIAPETLAGLGGLASTSGLGGRWAPARYLSALSASVGGALDFGAGEGRVWLAFSCPV
jgi:histidine phosphotransferase ChpT